MSDRHSYDSEQVQEWIDEIESALEMDEEFWQEDRELAEMYESLETHYEAAQDLLESGREADAYYELEKAYDILESDRVVSQVNKALHLEYSEFLDEDLDL